MQNFHLVGRPDLYNLVGRMGAKNMRVIPVTGGDSFLVPVSDYVPNEQNQEPTVNLYPTKAEVAKTGVMDLIKMIRTPEWRSAHGLPAQITKSL